MANFQHLKASRTRVLTTFPTQNFGNDGDIVISRISGRGVFICTKAGGMWYVANQMQEISRLGKTTIKDLTIDKLTVKEIINAEDNIDDYLVSDLGNIKSKTGKQLVNDLPLPFNNIAYKSAYCSLEQYSDKETCEANGGTWYYSENDTHDSISSTAENQLLTISQMHNAVDAEPTLLYDGSVLEIKRNTNYDDNWQTATNDNVLKLSYSSSVSSTLGTDSGGALKITASNTDLSGTLEISTIAEVGSDTDKFLMSDSGVVKFVTGANLRSYIGAGTGDGDITGVSITTDSGSGSKAEDTAGSADFSILGSNGVGVTNSGTTITAVAVPAEIDHDSLSNFVANEHVDHTSITLTAGDGLTGGGDISSNRSFAVSVDDSTIEISSDSLRVKDDGITYAKLQNVTDARMLGNNAGSDGVVTEMTKANVLSFLNVADGANANVSGDSGNAAIYDNSGTPAFKSGITKAEVLSLLNVADGAGVAPTNFVTNDADDTMAGSLTIDKDSTATTTANVSGLSVDFDHTGITAAGQTINNRAFIVALNSNSPTHVGAVNNFGIVNSVTGGTSGTQINYGLYNTVISADTNVGIYQKVTDGGTDLQFASSADTGDYFSIATTTHGATTIATVDDDATAADLTLDIDGDINLDADGGDITFKDDSASLATINGDGLTINNIGSDSAGDNYLVEVSGLVKKRTPAETLADIGAQATVTAGTNCTFLGATLNVDDAFITNAGDDTMSGTLTINKDSSATSTVSNYGQKIDLDHTGNTGAGQVITNYGLDVDLDFTGANATGGNTNNFGINLALNSESGSHSASSGIDNTAIKAVLTGDTDTGDTTQVGYDLTITGGDAGSQTGLLVNTDDGSTDLKIVSSADTADYFSIATTTNGATTLTTVDGGATAANLTLDIDGDIISDSHSGNFISKKAGTEFSVASSAYAGMILGYRMIGEDAGHSTEVLTTSLAVVDSAMTVRFVAPPSGNVEIMVQIYANSITSNRSLYVGLSDNATYNTIGATYEHIHRLADETDDELIQHYWTVTGLTAGDTYNYWFGARASSTNLYLNWGGTSSLRYPDFIMKATALPAATSDFAEYD